MPMCLMRLDLRIVVPDTRTCTVWSSYLLSLVRSTDYAVQCKRKRTNQTRPLIMQKDTRPREVSMHATTYSTSCDAGQ